MSNGNKSFGKKNGIFVAGASVADDKGEQKILKPESATVSN